MSKPTTHDEIRELIGKAIADELANQDRAIILRQDHTVHIDQVAQAAISALSQAGYEVVKREDLKFVSVESLSSSKDTG